MNTKSAKSWEGLLRRELVLASASPYRLKILKDAGITVRAETSRADEREISDHDPVRLALGRAHLKAAEVARRFPDALVIGADQVLSLGGELFTKAKDENDAASQLAKLAGKTHHLHSAYTLSACIDGGVTALKDRVVSVPMRMRPLSASEIKAYGTAGEWRGSVGAYKIEGMGAQLFGPPLGDYYAIVGLPLLDLTADLRTLGVDLLLNPRGPWTLTG